MSVFISGHEWLKKILPQIKTLGYYGWGIKVEKKKCSLNMLETKYDSL